MVRGLLAVLLLAGATPVAAAPTPRQMVEIASLSSLALSPDGQWVAFRQDRASVGANRQDQTWWVAPTDGRAPAQPIADAGVALWGAAGDPLTAPPVWSADGRWIYYRASRDGAVQVWRARFDGAQVEQVTHDDADVDAFTLEPDARLTYVVRATRTAILAAEQAAYDQGVVIDQTVDPAQNLFAAIEVNGRLSAQRLSGFWFQRGGVLEDHAEQRRAIDLRTMRAVEPRAGEGPPARTQALAPSTTTLAATRSPDGLGRILLTQSMRGSRLEVEREAGVKRLCQAAPCLSDRVVSAAWRPGRDQIVLITSDRAARSAVYLWDPERDAARQVLAFDGLLSGGDYGQPCAVRRDAAVCVAASALSPPRLVRLDLARGSLVTLDAPNGGLDAEAGLKVETLTWRDDAGHLFTGQYVTAPAVPPAKAPLFVSYYHCDGYLKGGTGDEWPFTALAQAGIAALCINETRSDSEDQDAVATYERALGGVRGALDLLTRRGDIDPRRVGMGGLSFGSEVALWVAMKSDLLAAVSISSVQLEPTYYWMNGVAGRDVHANLRAVWGLGAPEETPERWRYVSPALNTEHIHAPVLMQMPEQEYRPTIELFARLSTSTTPVDLVVFVNEPHILTQPRHRLAAYDRNIDWFRFWLQGYVDPAPAKAGQYQRWRAEARKGAGAKPPSG